MAQAKDEAALERELLSGEAWIAYCDRMKAIGLRILEQDVRILARQMEKFFFGEGAEQPAGYVPPSA